MPMIVFGKPKRRQERIANMGAKIIDDCLKSKSQVGGKEMFSMGGPKGQEKEKNRQGLDLAPNATEVPDGRVKNIGHGCNKRARKPKYQKADADVCDNTGNFGKCR